MQWGGEVAACIHLHMMGEGGSNFCHFGAYISTE